LKKRYSLCLGKRLVNAFDLNPCISMQVAMIAGASAIAYTGSDIILILGAGEWRSNAI